MLLTFVYSLAQKNKNAMNQKLLFLSALLALSVVGCKPEDDGPIGGKGGNASLRVTTKHHEKLIDSMTVYIKYNTLSKPGDGTRYDDSAKVMKTPADTVAIFTGLKTGRYYLYGYGYDLRFTEPDVVGGVPITITEEKEYKVLCPVSEKNGH